MSRGDETFFFHHSTPRFAGGLVGTADCREVSEMMARVPAETAAKIAGSASHKGNFYAVLDREDMNRSGVFPNWLDAEYVKKSASGYGKYGTKQDCIEGALEELDTMIKHYNLICMKKLGNK